MEFKIKNLIDLKDEFNLTLLCGESGLNHVVKGIRIIENENIEKFLWGGELLLTGFLPYNHCTVSQFETHINNLIKKIFLGLL